MKVDIFFKRFVNFVVTIFALRANSKFQFVGTAFTPKHLLQNKQICFVLLQLFDKAFYAFHVRFIKIINVY